MPSKGAWSGPVDISDGESGAGGSQGYLSSTWGSSDSSSAAFLAQEELESLVAFLL